MIQSPIATNNPNARRFMLASGSAGGKCLPSQVAATTSGNASALYNQTSDVSPP